MCSHGCIVTNIATETGHTNTSMSRQHNRTAVERPAVYTAEPQSGYTSHPLLYNSSVTSVLSPDFDINTLSQNELTVVTAYLNFGSFQKGFGGSFTPEMYRKWLTVFAQIKNPVVAYFDKSESADLMRVVRAKHPRTYIRVVDRKTMRSFREMQPRIAQIFAKPGYPRHPPNTVVPEYSVAMHAKYEFVQWAIRDSPFHTAYICWLDVGYFRDLVKSAVAMTVNDDELFRLWIPPHLNTSRVAYTQVYPPSARVPSTAQQFVAQNFVWVGGGCFIGRVDVVWHWITEYFMAVDKMLSEQWISTDQQVIAWLFLGEGKQKLKPTTRLQLYTPDGSGNGWFHLGYLAKKSGEQNLTLPT